MESIQTKAVEADLLKQTAAEAPRTTVYLDKRTRDTARELGDGNMSAGWRILAAAARASDETMKATKHAGIDQLFAELKADR